MSQMVWRRYIAAAAIGIGFVCVGLSVAQTREAFKTRLAPVPMDAAMRGTITGIGSATAALAGTKLTVAGSFEGLKSPATAAKLYQGRAVGVRGPAVFDLTVTPAASGSISGSFDLTPSQLDALKNGKFYIQIDSEKAAGGNLWGWLEH